MRLVHINPPEPVFTFICKECGNSAKSYDTRYQDPWKTAYADLDGEPFKAYYCQDCGRSIMNETRRNAKVSD